MKDKKDKKPEKKAVEKNISPHLLYHNDIPAEEFEDDDDDFSDIFKKEGESKESDKKEINKK